MTASEKYSRLLTIRHQITAYEASINQLTKRIGDPEQFTGADALIRAHNTINNLTAQRTRLKRKYARLKKKL